MRLSFIIFLFDNKCSSSSSLTKFDLQASLEEQDTPEQFNFNPNDVGQIGEICVGVLVVGLGQIVDLEVYIIQKEGIGFTNYQGFVGKEKDFDLRSKRGKKKQRLNFSTSSEQSCDQFK